MVKISLLIICLVLVSSCARKPTVIEFYPPETAAEKEAGVGALKTLDFRKPNSGFTLFDFSIF